MPWRAAGTYAPLPARQSESVPELSATRYNSGDYSFSDGSKEKIVKYNFFDSGYLEQVTINSSNKTIYGYVDDNGKLYTKLSDAQDEVEGIGKTGTILNLRVSARNCLTLAVIAVILPLVISNFLPSISIT